MIPAMRARPAAYEGLGPGFGNVALDSQRVFRRLLEAMARPGSIVSIDTEIKAPAPLSTACAALCLALIDSDTAIWLDPATSSDTVVGYLRFHCGAPIVATPHHAMFALIGDASRLPALETFHAGDDEYPERSATLLIQVTNLRSGDGEALVGPGIGDRRHFAVEGLRADFWQQWRANHALYPRGVDVVFIAGNRIAALPRSTGLEG